MGEIVLIEYYGEFVDYKILFCEYGFIVEVVVVVVE